jgi:hypothetical protein
MSERKLRCHQYVNRPYGEVRDILGRQTLDIFQRATRSAAARASAIGASLHAEVAGFDVGVDVHIHVHGIRDDRSATASPKRRCIASSTTSSSSSVAIYPQRSEGSKAP